MHKNNEVELAIRNTENIINSFFENLENKKKFNNYKKSLIKNIKSRIKINDNSQDLDLDNYLIEENEILIEELKVEIKFVADKINENSKENQIIEEIEKLIISPSKDELKEFNKEINEYLDNKLYFIIKKKNNLLENIFKIKKLIKKETENIKIIEKYILSKLNK